MVIRWDSYIWANRTRAALEEIHEDYFLSPGSAVASGVGGMNKQALKKNRIRKGDVVVVIAGRDRGKSGKVLSVDPGMGKVVVEKVNMIKRHTKPNQKVKQGGILEREAPFAVSNVMYLCPVTQKPTRLGVRTLDDGRRVRFSKKSNDSVE